MSVERTENENHEVEKLQNHTAFGELEESCTADVEHQEIQETYKIGNVNILDDACRLHCGSKLVYYEPVFLSGLSEENVINICDNYNVEDELKENKNVLHKIRKTWNVKKCILLGTLVTIIEVIILILISIITSGNEKTTVNWVNVSRIREMNKNIFKFLHINDWKFEDECTFVCPIRQETKARLVFTKQNWYHCKYHGSDPCYDEFFQDFNRYTNDSSSPLNHILYNYIIGVGSEITEGRPLTCPFDESFFTHDHSSVITVGIPYCYPGNSKINNILAESIAIGVKELLKKLKEYSIISDNFSLELPDICNGSLIFKKLNPKHPVSFYNYQLYNTTVLNPEIMRTFLFTPDDNSPISPVNITRRETWLPPKSQFGSCRLIDPSKFNESNKIRFVIDSDYDVSINTKYKKEIFANNTGCHDIKWCKSNILKLINSDSKYKVSIRPANYYIFMSGHVFEGASLNCSLTNNNTIIVRIVVFEIYNSQLSKRKFENYILELSKLIQTVINDIRMVKKYEVFDIGQICNFVFVTHGCFDIFLRFVTDVVYVESRIMRRPDQSLPDICDSGLRDSFREGTFIYVP